VSCVYAGSGQEPEYGRTQRVSCPARRGWRSRLHVAMRMRRIRRSLGAKNGRRSRPDDAHAATTSNPTFLTLDSSTRSNQWRHDNLGERGRPSGANQGGQRHPFRASALHIRRFVTESVGPGMLTASVQAAYRWYGRGNIHNLDALPTALAARYRGRGSGPISSLTRRRCGWPAKPAATPTSHPPSMAGTRSGGAASMRSARQDRAIRVRVLRRGGGSCPRRRRASILPR